jgi:DNA sulfur modification protein DndE
MSLIDSKLKLTPDMCKKLTSLSARTSLSWNILCRHAFTVSLMEESPPPLDNASTFEKDIAKHLIVGEYETLMLNLLNKRKMEWKLGSDYNSFDFFRSLISRGIDILSSKGTTLL